MAKENRRYPDQYIVRFPDGMRDKLKKAAKENNRSLNAEIIHLIERGQASTNNQITPRDLFAAAALNASIGLDSATVEIAMTCSFLMADEMMKKRNKGQV